MILRILILFGIVMLTGCAANRVTFQNASLDSKEPVRKISAQQSLCEIEKDLSLFVDANRNLWLNCPYRYQGVSVPSVAYIGPKPLKGQSDFVYGEATNLMKGMKKIALRNCGRKQYCGEVKEFGYESIVIQLENNNVANINYYDVSEGLVQLEKFYAELDGRLGSAKLDPGLLSRIEVSKVVTRINQLISLEQIVNVHDQLTAIGLIRNQQVNSVITSRKRILEISSNREKGSFEGYASAYKASQENSDLDAMQKLAIGSEQKSAVFVALVAQYQRTRSEELLISAKKFISKDSENLEYQALSAALEAEKQLEARRREAARQEELQRQEEARQRDARTREEILQRERRRQDETRQADLRKQEEVRLANEREAQKRAEEEKCMKDRQCRQEMEQRQAICTQKIQTCRAQCDRATGAGTFSFFGNLAAAGMARVCYSACKC